MWYWTSSILFALITQRVITSIVIQNGILVTGGDGGSLASTHIGQPMSRESESSKLLKSASYESVPSTSGLQSTIDLKRPPLGNYPVNPGFKQFPSEVSKSFIKKPEFIKERVTSNLFGNAIPILKHIPNFFRSGGKPIINENSMDAMCAGQLLETPTGPTSKVVSFLCPRGSVISYTSIGYREMIFRSKKKISSFLHRELAISGLFLGCDDHSSVIAIGSITKITSDLRLPDVNKSWINFAEAYVSRSIMGNEYISALVLSGPDILSGISSKFHPSSKMGPTPPINEEPSMGHFISKKKWNANFFRGACVGLHSNSQGIWITKFGLIPLMIDNSIELLPVPNISQTKTIVNGLQIKGIIVIPKLWPECQMIFSKYSGKELNNNFVIKTISNKDLSEFNVIEVVYNKNYIPKALIFKELTSDSFFILGDSIIHSNDLRKIRKGKISSITFGFGDSNNSFLDSITFFEAVVDGKVTIFINNQNKNYYRTFSGKGLKYICVELSSYGSLVGFGAFFSQHTSLLPFVNQGIQFSYANSYFRCTKDCSETSVLSSFRFTVPNNNILLSNKLINFNSTNKVQIYTEIIPGISECNLDLNTYIPSHVKLVHINCKTGYMFNSLSWYYNLNDGIITGIKIGCDGEEVSVGKLTNYINGLNYQANNNKQNVDGFTFAFSGSIIDPNFKIVEASILNSNKRAIILHDSLDTSKKLSLTPSRGISWYKKGDENFQGFCFALDTKKLDYPIIGMFLGKDQNSRFNTDISGLSLPLFAPYDSSYRYYDSNHIAFGYITVKKIFINKQQARKYHLSETNLVKVSVVCPVGHIISNIQISSNPLSTMAGSIAILCSDSYSGAIIGSSDNLFYHRNIDIISFMLKRNIPQYIQRIKFKLSASNTKRLVGSLEAETFYSENNRPYTIYSYLSKKMKKGLKSNLEEIISDGPFDGFSVIVRSKNLTKKNLSKEKEGIISINFRPSKNVFPPLTRNLIKSIGKILIAPIEFPQCQMIRAPSNNRLRISYSITCPESSEFTSIQIFKATPDSNSKIAAVKIICSLGSFAIIGNPPVEIFSKYSSVSKISDFYGYPSVETSKIRKIMAFFDPKKSHITALDWLSEDGNLNEYPPVIGTNRQNNRTYQREFVGNILKMICIEVSPDSNEVTGFGAFFWSQGINWLPPIELEYTLEDIQKGTKNKLEYNSKLLNFKNVDFFHNSKELCNIWGGLKKKSDSLSIGFSCKESLINHINICSKVKGLKISGIEVTCSSSDDSYFVVGNCSSTMYKSKMDTQAQIGSVEFGFTKITGELGFFLVSNIEKTVLSTYSSNKSYEEGIGSMSVWSMNEDDKLSNSNLIAMCFDLDENESIISAIGFSSVISGVISDNGFEIEFDSGATIKSNYMEKELLDTSSQNSKTEEKSIAAQNIKYNTLEGESEKMAPFSLNEKYGTKTVYNPFALYNFAKIPMDYLT
ncbi:uncharacterized protein CMU_014640 [Cryptosporidium muris RN66]|uniref:Uncharacterized protein n=1 Tax=Cryptosporidium muris (strain RN66) TaxID=441375 RepID=B6AF21_CRYMR|nr:uncharacterized protein CMU_014640 [Cryptosporidium muris RN66]EEA06788.1 hypothetical protein, conserved [Cryptosporidium muris RN66]|eukprot:XP_002141137.1 hypothetical protein [Cryptosporidium muris RN66]